MGRLCVFVQTNALHSDRPWRSHSPNEIQGTCPEIAEGDPDVFDTRRRRRSRDAPVKSRIFQCRLWSRQNRRNLFLATSPSDLHWPYLAGTANQTERRPLLQP